MEEEELGFWGGLWHLCELMAQALYDNMVEGLAVIAILLAKVFYDLSEEIVVQLFTIASAYIQDLALSPEIQTAWSALPSDSREVLTFFRIPECLNNLLAFGATKFAMRFIPFMG